MKKLISILICFLPLSIFAQDQLTGYVYEANEGQKENPLPGANLVWLNTTEGTSTQFDGSFSLPLNKASNQLVISYVGFKTDTITVTSAKPIKHWLRRTTDLDEVVLQSEVKGTSKSYIQSENIQYVSSDELLKAACCNLSESFETNPSIDVNFSDAVTGTKQIKMLGLSSPYILIATENIPSVRGASQAYGLSFIPGTWVQSIQITKGAGSVVNGYESIFGTD